MVFAPCRNIWNMFASDWCWFVQRDPQNTSSFVLKGLLSFFLWQPCSYHLNLWCLQLLTYTSLLERTPAAGFDLHSLLRNEICSSTSPSRNAINCMGFLYAGRETSHSDPVVDKAAIQRPERPRKSDVVTVGLHRAFRIRNKHFVCLPRYDTPEK